MVPEQMYYWVFLITAAVVILFALSVFLLAVRAWWRLVLRWEKRLLLPRGYWKEGLEIFDDDR